MSKSVTDTTRPLYPFATLLLGLLSPEYFRAVVEEALHQRKRSSSPAAAELGRMLEQSGSPIPGFRNASKAPPHRIAEPLANWCWHHRHEWWIRRFLLLWMEGRSPLRDAAQSLVKRLNGPTTFALSSAQGFVDFWEPEQLEDWTRQLEHAHPGVPQEALQLMLSCVTGRVLIPPEFREKFLETDMPSETDQDAAAPPPPADKPRQGLWQQWLQAASALAADAPEWVELDTFITQLRSVAESKVKEREEKQAHQQAQQLLATELNTLKESCGTDLEFFGFTDTLGWTADVFAPKDRPEATREVMRLREALLQHRELKQCPPAKKLGEERALRSQIERLEDEATSLYRGLCDLRAKPPEPPDGSGPESSSPPSDGAADPQEPGVAAPKVPAAQAGPGEPAPSVASVPPGEQSSPKQDSRSSPALRLVEPLATEDMLPPPTAPSPALAVGTPKADSVARSPLESLEKPEASPEPSREPEPTPQIDMAGDSVAEEQALAPPSPASQLDQTYFQAGLERLALLDTPGAFIMLEASGAPCIPWLVFLIEQAFSVVPPLVERTSSPEIDKACASVLATADEWTPLAQSLAGLACTSLVVLDGISSPPVHRLFHMVREQAPTAPPHLSPFLRFWDVAHKPVVSLRKLLEDERALNDQLANAARSVLEALMKCRHIQFDFTMGNRFIAKVFPPNGGPFAWLETAMVSSDLPAIQAAHAQAIEELKNLSPEDCMDDTCKTFGKNKKIEASARDAIRQRMLELRECFKKWEVLASALIELRAGHDGTSFFRRHLRELSRECQTLRLPEARSTPDHAVNAIASRLLARGRTLLGTHS